MTDAFDPFQDDEEDIIPLDSSLMNAANVSMTSSHKNTSFMTEFSADPHNQFDSSFQTDFSSSFASVDNVSTSKNNTNITSTSAANIDQDIFSQLFFTPAKVNESTFSINQSTNFDIQKELFPSASFLQTTPPKVDHDMLHPPPTNADQAKPRVLYPKTQTASGTVAGPRNPAHGSKVAAQGGSHSEEQSILPVRVALHEELSCVYDEPSSQQASSRSVAGTITIEPTREMSGKTVHLSIDDPQQHIGTLTSYFDYATELTDRGVEGEDSFVTREREASKRVFRVRVPGQIRWDAKPIPILKYTGSKNLRPVPLLVHSKVRVAGKFCRVGVKIRSNPACKQPVRNVVVLMAIPPDVDGETMKMSINGGTWDPMKRVIVWSWPQLPSGDTMEVQLQFHYLGGFVEDVDKTPPRFPILVRCDGILDQLSDIAINVGGKDESQEGNIESNKEETPYHLVLSQTYRIFHRKV